MDLYSSGLTIGDLAKRTGIGLSTLRAWERRHGFPVPQRLPSGHRRYVEADVEGLLAVVRDRAAGSTLESALSRARARRQAPRSSVFATVRETLPEVAPVSLSHAAMFAVSRAIEDEAAVRADAPIFVGSFQMPHHWRRTKPTWRRLADRSHAVVAVAAQMRNRAGSSLYEVGLPARHPMAQEWAVICDSPSFAACLVGVERPARDDGGRVFEALWTVDPAGVREAARTAAAVASSVGGPFPPAAADRLREPPVATYDTVRAANALMNRALVYLDRRSPRSSGIV